MSEAIKNRYEFVYLFDVENGNPNGDPDAGNMPRIDPETGHGIVTDVCLKRKVRNYIEIAKELKPPFDIFVREGVFLNSQIEKAYETSEEVKKALADWQAWQKDKKDKKKTKRPEKHYEDIARQWMCDNFYDVRTFGAVMTTGDKEENEEDPKSKIRRTAGQVRGPVQIGFSRSREPIASLDASISVCAARSENNPEQKGIIGRKPHVPYGLYCCEGFISAHFANKTGFSEDDLMLLWKAMCGRQQPNESVSDCMFDHDHSAARGKMAARKLVVFKHNSAMGNASAQALFDLVKVNRTSDITKPARAFLVDYKVELDRNHVPQGVELIEML